MSTTVISQKKDKIVETKTRGEEILTYKDIDNFLDQILEVQKVLNLVNDIYLDLYNDLDEITRIELTNDSDSSEAKEIMDILNSFNTFVGRMFSKILKNTDLANGCKSVLLDLRINIRNLREYLCDLEEVFFLSEDDKEFHKSISNLI